MRGLKRIAKRIVADRRILFCLAAALALASSGIFAFHFLQNAGASYVIVERPAPTPHSSLSVHHPPSTALTSLPAANETPPAAAPTPEPTSEGLCGERYDVFTDGEVIQTETEYRSKDVAVFFSEVSEEKSELTGKRLVYYVADIYVQDIGALRCALARGKLRNSSPMRSLARGAGAVVALSGDFASIRKKGICVRNGVTYRSSVDARQDVGALGRDGRMRTFEIGEYTVQGVLAMDPWHVWTFGPELLENGKAKAQFNSSVQGRNPRSVFGYYEPGHYCLVLVRGRVDVSEGMCMAELSRLMERLGCVSAFNLDGGRSAQIYWNGKVYPAARTPRNINDIIYL